MRFASAEVKQKIMRQKKNLKNSVRFADDVTKRNLDLMKNIRENEKMESAWYYNTCVYGGTKSGLQLKIDLFDNVEQRIQEESDKRR